MTNNDWACQRDDESDGASTNDSQKGSNAYYYHIADRNAPTISGIVDGDDKSLNSSSGTTNNTSNYTKSNQVKVTIGSEDVATGGITWTRKAVQEQLKLVLQH